MKLIARVEGDEYVARWVQLFGQRFTVDTRPPIARGVLITFAMPGLAAPTFEAVTAWIARAYGERVRAFRPQTYRPTSLADFMEAVNAHEHIAAAASWNADLLVAFARDRGGALLAEIRHELEHDARLAGVAERARRFATILQVVEAPAVLDELAKHHEVDQLVGLEHAVARWLMSASSPRNLEVATLAKDLPGDGSSAGISDEWFQWWWRLARACTRTDLVTIVDRAIDRADEECRTNRKQPVALDALDEARRLVDIMRTSRTARLWADPPDPARRVSQLVRDEADAHYAAFMAVTHAAHAIAHALMARIDAARANRQSMTVLASLAVAVLQEDAGETP